MLEIPFKGEGGIDKESLIIVGVVDEVVADLYLTTKAQMFVEVIPELGLGEDDELTMAISILTTPEINEA